VMKEKRSRSVSITVAGANTDPSVQYTK